MLGTPRWRLLSAWIDGSEAPRFARERSPPFFVGWNLPIPMAGEITQISSLLILLLIYTIGTELGTSALAVSEAPHPGAKTPKPAFGQHGERQRVVVWWFVRVLWHLTAQLTEIRSERPQSGVVFRCFMLISTTISESIKRKRK